MEILVRRTQAAMPPKTVDCTTKGKKKKQRPGRVERLKQVIRKKDTEFRRLTEHNLSVKKLAIKAVANSKHLRRYRATSKLRVYYNTCYVYVLLQEIE